MDSPVVPPELAQQVYLEKTAIVHAWCRPLGWCIAVVGFVGGLATGIMIGGHVR